MDLSLSPQLVVVVPIVLGLVQAVKTVGVPSNLSPVIAMIFGIAICYLLQISWPGFLLQGIVVGLASSGLWSGVKSQLSDTPAVSK